MNPESSSQNDTEKCVALKKPASKFIKKDWQPLGTIRDSFAVLLEQDATWERYRP